MKATELMIGDWVKDKYKPIPHKVDSWADFNSSEDLSPIPLTSDILEKNENVKELGYWDKETDVFRLYAVPIVNLWDVHILQHALRLCGLDKLADNFKVN